MDLAGKVVMLTGASRGIGVRVAEALARKSARLALAARSKDSLEETAARVRASGADAITVPTDVTSQGDLERFVERTQDELGPPDVLINNAGIECVGHFEELDLDLIEATIATNLTGAMTLARLVAPIMLARGRGHICNVASAAGKAARPYGVVYSGTKHGLVGFSWGLRAELAPRGVEVSVVCPGYVTGEGMFAEREGSAGTPPRNLGLCTAERVADEVVKSIEKNRAEVVIAPAFVKVADVIHALSPDLAIGIARRTGAYSYLRKEATGRG
jgi:short-subunit dehydrogenase